MILIAILLSSLSASVLDVETLMIPESQITRVDATAATSQKDSAAAKNGSIAVDVYKPEGRPMADLLVLPGWNFSRKRWQNETQLIKFCHDKKYRCIFPEMGVTLYESRYFAETTLKWAAIPGGEWIQKILIPELQKKGMLKKNGKNFMLGLSTGGRGVALVSLQNPGLFSGGASLSGDFNQTAMEKDRLMTAVYGEFAKNRERWQSVDNPQNEAEMGNWKMPIYLGHGKSDRVVPWYQSKTFFSVLESKYPDLKKEFSEPDEAGHDFSFWNNELEKVFTFFHSLGG